MVEALSEDQSDRRGERSIPGLFFPAVSHEAPAVSERTERKNYLVPSFLSASDFGALRTGQRSLEIGFYRGLITARRPRGFGGKAG